MRRIPFPARAAMVATIPLALSLVYCVGDDPVATTTLPDAAEPDATGTSDAGGPPDASGDVLAPCLPGALDPSFAEGGVGVYPIHRSGAEDNGTPMALAPDGESVFIGSTERDVNNFVNVVGWSVAKVRGDGTLDPSFGDNGRVPSPPNAVPSPNGLVAFGSWLFVGGSQAAPPFYALGRLQSNGTVDQSFADGGIATATGVSGFAISLGRDVSDGLVLAGRILGGGANVVRFDKAGSRDTSYGADGGTAFVDSGTGVLQTIALDGLALAGATNAGQTGSAAVFRLLASGAIDSTYGTAGFVRDFGATEADSITIDTHTTSAAGRAAVVVAGTSGPTDANYRPFAARISPDGQTVAPFKPLPGDPTNAAFYGVAVAADGKIVVCGQILVQQPDRWSWLVARFLPDGSVDTGFGKGGYVTTSVLGNDVADSIAIDKDGRIVVAGNAKGSGPQAAAVARYCP